jgi:hypothetical protein
MTKPIYSGLLGRLMTEKEIREQEEYLAQKSAEVRARYFEEQGGGK